MASHIGEHISWMHGQEVKSLFDVRKVLETPNNPGEFKIQLNGIDVPFTAKLVTVDFHKSISEYFLGHFAPLVEKNGWKFSCKPSQKCDQLKDTPHLLYYLHINNGSFSKEYKSDSKRYLGIVLWIFSPMHSTSFLFKFGEKIANVFGTKYQESFSFKEPILFG